MKLQQSQLISLGALIALAGFIFSGPASFFVVQWLAPQPSWISTRIFVENYDPLQNLPYYFGFVLVGGMMFLAVAQYIKQQGKRIGTG